MFYQRLQRCSRLLKQRVYRVETAEWAETGELLPLAAELRGALQVQRGLAAAQSAQPPVSATMRASPSFRKTEICLPTKKHQRKNITI